MGGHIYLMAVPLPSPLGLVVEVWGFS